MDKIDERKRKKQRGERKTKSDKDLYESVCMRERESGRGREIKWKRVKKKSVLLFFSKRIYIIYRIVVDNEEFMNILLTFYNYTIMDRIVLDR